MKKYGFGVDVGGTTVKIGFFETTGKLIDKWEIKTNTKNEGASILPDITKAIEDKIASENISKDDIQGIGVGVPGPVTSTGVVNRCVNLGWGVFNIEEELSKLTGLKVKAGNDANVAALGEMWQGAAKGSRDVIMVTLGTGVGGGVIVDGNIISGANGAGGEIGHINVDKDEIEPCNCGKCGCLEQYASATGIVRMATRRLNASDEETTLRGKELSAKLIFDEAKEGDKVSEELVEKLGEILGSTLADIACVSNPEVIVIGGGVSKAGTILTDVIQKYYKKNCFHACENAKFVIAGLGNDAGMYGCMQMILD